MNSESPILDAGKPGKVFPWPTIALAMVAGTILLLAVWLPQRYRIRSLEARYAAVRERIDDRANRRPGPSLDANIHRVRATNIQLRAELAYWISRRNSFPDTGPIAQLGPSHDEGRIDFKVALFNARTNLLARAQLRNTLIPQSLGMDETIRSDTRVETALAQLAATVRLVERIMQAGVPEISRIQPLAPRMHALQHAPYSKLRECPIEIELHGSFDQCLHILTLLALSESGFSLERFDLTKPPLLESDAGLLLRLVATAGLPLPRHRLGSPRKRNALPRDRQRIPATTGRAYRHDDTPVIPSKMDPTNRLRRETTP